MFEYTIGDSSRLVPFNMKFLILRRKHPEWFYDDFEIKTVYGCPRNCIWNGGGVNQGVPDFRLFKLAVKEYQKMGVGYRLTFSNRLLRPEHMYDTLGNATASYSNTPGNGVLVSTDVMQHHIEKNYKNLEIVQSITRCYSSIEEINKASEKYITVLPIIYNNDWDVLKKLKHPENIEVLVNQTCVENCPYNQQHYDSYNKYTLFESDDYMFCQQKENAVEKQFNKRHNVPHDLLKHYADLGINKMKIAGRGRVKTLLISYLEMFTKPEYFDIVSEKLTTFEPGDWHWTGSFIDIAFNG